MEYTFWIPTIISIVSLVWNFTQSKKIIKLETEAEAKRVIQKYQFEKEFNIYVELWKKLIDLRNTSASLRPMLEYVDKSKSHEEIRNDKLRGLNDKFNEVVNEFEYNRPFYSKKVYNEIEKVLRTSRFEAIDFEHMTERSKEDWEQSKKNINQIIDSVDKVSDLIRKRIEFIET